MTTAYTSLLGLALPVTGELSGTWGSVVNDSITSLLDTSVAGTTNVSADSNVTLTTTTGASNQARQAILLFSGARTAVRTVTAPAQSKIYTVINATTGGYAVTLVGAGPTTGVTIVAGESAVCAWNGSDFVKVSNTGGSGTFTNLTVTGIATFSATSGFIVNSAASTSAKFIDIENTSGSLFAGVSSSTGTGIMSSGRAYSAALAGQAGIQFSGNNGTTVHMDLDTSGNLGLGVTPTGTSKFELYTGSGSFNGVTARFNASNAPISFSVANSNGFPYLGFNTVQVAGTDNQTYATTNFASRLDSGSGGFRFFTAPSGTAGNAITFTQAMTLDASGRLYLGTTSTGSAGLNVSADCNGTANNNSCIHVFSSSGAINSNNGGRITFGESDATPYGEVVFLRDGNNTFKINNRASGALTFGTNNTERARIDSSGNLLVGTTSGQNSKFVSDGGSGTALWGKCSTAATAVNVIWNSATSGDNQLVYLYTDTAPNLRGSIVYNRAGGIVVYSTTSDYRAKDIYGPVTDSGTLIDSVPVYMGKMKGATQERPMFIAHETPAYAHTGEKDAVDADGNPVYQQMDASALIPVMWAELQSLRKRLADAGIA